MCDYSQERTAHYMHRNGRYVACNRHLHKLATSDHRIDPQESNSTRNLTTQQRSMSCRIHSPVHLLSNSADTTMPPSFYTQSMKEGRRRRTLDGSLPADRRICYNIDHNVEICSGYVGPSPCSRLCTLGLSRSSRTCIEVSRLRAPTVNKQHTDEKQLYNQCTRGVSETL